MKKSIPVIVFFLLLFKTVSATDYYVNASSGDNSTGDGTSSKPWKTITFALEQMTGTGQHTIFVSAGTYNTTLGEIFPLFMVDGVSLVGNGKDVTIINADNSNYVITCSGILDPGVKIEGFTITGGKSAGPGGIYISAGSLLRITNNLITANIAEGEYSGGAVHILNSSPLIENNLITENHGTRIDKGACIFITGSTSAPVISFNTISENINDIDAGGGIIGAGTIVVIDASGTVINNNVITNNNPSDTWEEGGVVYIRNCSPSVKYNLIAGSNGNGICVFYSVSSPSIVNNTISDHAHYGIFLYSATPDSIFNNIISYNSEYGVYEYSAGYDPEKVWYNLFYQNGSGLYYDEKATVYTSVAALNADVAECKNNIEGNPLFVDRTNNNYHLKIGSPAINAGDPLSALDPDGSRADIGAYYYTPPPAPPNALSPSGVTYNSFDANWTMPEGATGYYLDVAIDAGFTMFVTGFNNRDVGNESVYLITDLLPNTLYYYRVRAYNLCGTSDNSNVISLATLQVPAPAPPAAIDATNITQTTFNANWYAADLAAGYYLDVGTDIGFTSFVDGFISKDVADVTISSVTGLSPFTDYYFRVRAYNDGGISDYSNTISLTTLQVLPPNAPAAKAATGITSKSFIVNWNASATATGYYLDVASDGGFAAFVDGYVAKDIGNVTSFEVTGLTSNTTYYYRVRAYNGGGESSNSIIISAKTLVEPPPAPIANEATDISQTSFTANWSSSGTATGYYLDVATDNIFTSFVTDYENLDVSDVLSYNITGLSPSTAYFYRVRAYNDGGAGIYSDTILVTTLLMTAPPAPVANEAPYVGQTDFTAGWTSSAAATGYYLDIAADNTFTAFITGYNNKDVLNVLTFSITGLTANTTYYYRIRAYNAGGTSASSNTISVTTLSVPPEPPPAPVVNDATDITQTSFTANWNSTDRATGYKLDVATNNAFSVFVTGYNNKDITNTNNFNITGLTANTTYYYRVCAYNSGGTSANSGTITLTTIPYPPSPPTCTSANSITQTSFTANWNASTGATGYFLDVAMDNSFTVFVTGCENIDVLNVLNFNISGLAVNTYYYYRVRAYNTGGTSANSNTITVTTLLNPPPAPSAPTALSATGITQTGFTARWNTSSTATGYRIDIASNNSFTSFLSGYYDIDVGNVTSTPVTGLTAGSTYYYRVRAYNSSGSSNNSNYIAITTLPDPPAAPSGLTGSSCNDQVTLTWSANTETDFLRYRIYGGTSANPTTKIDSTATGTISAVTKTLSGLTHGQTYYFRITAVISPGVESQYSSAVTVVVKKGVVPRIKSKFQGAVLICYNIGDSISSWQWYRGTTAISGATEQYYATNNVKDSYSVLTTDKNGCKNSSNIINTTGSKSVSVFPNPAEDNFTLKFSSEFVGRTMITLYNASGVKVFEYQTEKPDEELECKIPVGNLPDGLYTVEIVINEEEVAYSRVMVIN